MIHEIYTLLGADTILLPYTNGRCVLTPDKMFTLTPAATHAPAYQQALHANDIVVPCGKVNRALCALVLHDLHLLDTFLRLNPDLKGTAAADTPTGLVFWLRSSGFTPPSFNGNRMSWLADNASALVRRCAPADPGWLVLRAGVPLPLNTAGLDLSPSPSLAEHWSLNRLAHRFGDPFRSTKNGGRSLNIEFWCGYAIELLHIRYHPGARVFDWVPSGATETTMVAPELLARQVGDLIFATTEAATPYRPRHDELMALLRHLRVQAAVPEPDADAVLQAFVQECLSPQRQSAVTAGELARACDAFCRARHLPPPSRNVILLRVGALLGQLFGTRASNSVVRDGRPHRGFRAISLRIPQFLEAGAARDGRDGVFDAKLELPTDPAAVGTATPAPAIP